MVEHPLYDCQVETLDGQWQDLQAYRGQVLCIVNVASRCGYRGQFAELNHLFRTYEHRGFSVLAFPCNQFFQEALSNAKLARWVRNNDCSVIDFPVFAKVRVNAPRAHPLYRHLQQAAPGWGPWIKWNFTKFLVNRQGDVVGRYAPYTSPYAMQVDVEAWLSR